MGTPCNQDTSCPLGGCFHSKFTDQSRQNYYEAFWKTGDEVLQDQYLMGCIKPRPVKRKRTTDPNKPPKAQWSYIVGADAIEVCRHTFMSIHGIKEERLRHVMGMKNQSAENIAHPDMRGKSKFGLIIM